MFPETKRDRRRRAPDDRRDGFTLVEVVAGIFVLVVGLVGIAGVMTATSRRTEELTVESRVLERTRSLLEEIKGVVPADVVQYDGRTYPVEGVTGNYVSADAIEVTVDLTNPRLVRVFARADWDVAGRSHTVELRTEIFDPQG